MAKKAHQKKVNLKKIKNWSFFLLPLLILGYFIFYKITDRYNYYIFVSEDSPIEYAQFFFFLLAGFLALITCVNLFKKRSSFFALYYLFFSLALFFVAFEEISWGQRILEIETPEHIAKKNVQDEITVHNLHPVQVRLPQAYIIIGLWGTFGWIVASKTKKRLPWIKNFFPPKTLSLYFFPVFAYYFWVEYLDEIIAIAVRDLALPQTDFPGKTTLSWLQFWFHKDLNFLDAYVNAQDQEPVEFIFSLGILLFTFNNFLKNIPKTTIAKPLKHLFSNSS